MRTPAVINVLESRHHLSANQVVGYLTNYSIEYANFDINKIDYSALTQINYFAAIPSAGGTISFSTGEQTRLNAVVAKAHSYGVTVSLSLGGVNQDHTLTAIIDQIALGNNGPLNTLVTSINNAKTNHGIDGIDLDWEPINTSLTRINAYGVMLQAIQAGTNMQVSAAVNAEKLWSVAGAAGPTNPDGRAYVLNEMSVKALDQIGVMTYDLEPANHSSWERSTNDLNNWAAEVERFGEPRDMLVFGVPFYGRSGDNWNNPLPSYKNLINKRLAQNPGETIAVNQDTLWVAFPTEYPGYNNGQGIEWFFNSRDTLYKKTNYANVTADVGGVMIWDLAQDHTDAQQHYTNYSLLPYIRSATNSNGTLAATAGTYAANASKPTVEITFNAIPDASTLGPADLVLTNITTGQTIDTAGEAHLHIDGATAGWSFHDLLLPDGNYTATLKGGSVRTSTGNVLANDYAANFFVLAGDANRNRQVEFNDLVALAQNYNGTGKTFAQGDFDYDSDVDFQDLVILSQQYNKTLAVAATITAPFSNTTIAGPRNLTEKPTSMTRTGGRVASDVLA